MLGAIERFLDRSAVRLVLASLIIVSVLPFEELRRLDVYFFFIFGTELVLRSVILKRRQRLSRGELAVLVTDTVALVSFLTFLIPYFPFLETFLGARVLRLIRLARLVVLGRFLRTVFADLVRILAQRQIRYQLVFLLAAVLLLTFLGGTILSTFGVPVEDFDGNGTRDHGTPGQVLWWTFQQIEDPGNLVADPRSGVFLLATSTILTIAGVFVMSFIIGIGTSVVGALMVASRHRPTSMRGHTVVIGGGRNVREVLDDLVEMYAKNRRKVRIAVLDEADEPPAYLEEPRFRGVEYRTGEATSVDAHKLLTTAEARRVIVLNDEELGEESDAYAVSAVLAVREQNEACPIVVEMRHRRYMGAARVAGGQNVNPIPMGKFLGSLVSHNVMFPGIDTVFEEILTARGSEIYSHLFSKEELRRLGGGTDGSVPFYDLLLGHYRRHGVITLGVFLGDGPWTDDVGALVLWLNPLDEPPEEALALGAERGRVPVASLRGIIAVAPDYRVNRIAALEAADQCLGNGVSHGAGTCAEPEGPPPFRATLSDDMRSLRRVLVLGDNELLPALMENTAEFVEGVEFFVVPSAVRAADLHDELRRRRGAPVARDDEAHSVTYPLERGGRATVLSSSGDMLASALEHPVVRSRPIDVTVLLADPEEADPDAKAALMLLRLLEAVDDGAIVVSKRFRVIAEALSGGKGARLEARLSREGGVSVRVVPTQQMRSYFLVDAAYMPGSERAHLELLSPHGQDFCQLQLRLEEDDQEITFAELLGALASQEPPVIAIGARLRGGKHSAGLLLNPSPKDETLCFRPSEVEVVYAVGETERFAPDEGDEKEDP